MVGRQRHLAAARKNEQFARDLLDDPDHLEWAAIVGFYAALHWVDAYLARQQIHPRNHADRDQYVYRTPLQPAYSAFRSLRTIADNARYDLIPLRRDTIERRLDLDLTAIREVVERLIQ